MGASRLIVDRAGNAHAAWQEYSEQEGVTLSAAFRPTGSAWSSPTLVAEGASCPNWRWMEPATWCWHGRLAGYTRPPAGQGLGAAEVLLPLAGPTEDAGAPHVRRLEPPCASVCRGRGDALLAPGRPVARRARRQRRHDGALRGLPDHEARGSAPLLLRGRGVQPWRAQICPWRTTGAGRTVSVFLPSPCTRLARERYPT